MSKQQLEMARTLIESKQYDEARKLLLTIDHPTAKKWLAKLDEIAPQTKTSVQKSAGANYIPLALGAVVVLVTFLLALYAAFIRPVGVSAAEIQPISTKLENIETSLKTSSQWEYLTMHYGQIDTMGVYGKDRNTIADSTYTDHTEYDKDFSDGCKSNDFECRVANFKGMRYYLEILGKDGWELVTTNDKSSSDVYVVELFFKRQQKTVGQ